MGYQEPSHGWWCHARTYPTRCRWCGAKIFYFSCDCGSKVFFNSLGWPWPIHDCTDDIIRQIDFKIEEEYRNRVAERSKKKDWVGSIRAVLPISGRIIEEIGIVREIISKADVWKKFNIAPDSAFTGLIGAIGKSECAQITIHVDDMASDKVDSYTFLIPKVIWNKLGASLGDLLCFKLVGKSIPGRTDYWLCDEIDWIDD